MIIEVFNAWWDTQRAWRKITTPRDFGPTSRLARHTTICLLIHAERAWQTIELQIKVLFAPMVGPKDSAMRIAPCCSGKRPVAGINCTGLRPPAGRSLKCGCYYVIV